eukprot:Gb_29106 [translate_table: standard]
MLLGWVKEYRHNPGGPSTGDQRSDKNQEIASSKEACLRAKTRIWWDQEAVSHNREYLHDLGSIHVPGGILRWDQGLTSSTRTRKRLCESSDNFELQNCSLNSFMSLVEPISKVGTKEAGDE